jgi:aryl-alcohol dehydrogenase-like predicted oxidoreductase
MEHRPLGRTGVSVSKFCLGAMMFGAWGNPDHDDSIRIIHAALDAGINFVDTADVYSVGESEQIVGKDLAGRRDDVVLATKVGFPMGDAPIIGPRTMEHLESQLAAADVVLDAALLDRIDELVPPSPNLNAADGGWQNPALQPAARRRWPARAA